MGKGPSTSAPLGGGVVLFFGDPGEGVFIDTAGATIGGTTAVAGNVISFNGQSGMRVFGLVGSPLNINNRIGSNSIFANGGLGINLGNDGVTPNDPGDADVGPNNLQNFPVIAAVSSVGKQYDRRRLAQQHADDH